MMISTMSCQVTLVLEPIVTGATLERFLARVVQLVVLFEQAAKLEHLVAQFALPIVRRVTTVRWHQNRRRGSLPGIINPLDVCLQMRHQLVLMRKHRRTDDAFDLLPPLAQIVRVS